MDREVNLARSFEDAKLWEIRQYREMTPDARRDCVKQLRDRVYGKDCPDVREAERARAS